MASRILLYTGLKCIYALLFTVFIGVLKSPKPDQEGNKLGSMSGTRAISTTSRRELSSSIFSLQGKAPKEIRSILTETLDCFLPGRAMDLSAPMYMYLWITGTLLCVCTGVKK